MCKYIWGRKILVKGKISLYMYVFVLEWGVVGGGFTQQCGRDILRGCISKSKGLFNVLVNEMVQINRSIYVYLREVYFG